MTCPRECSMCAWEERVFRGCWTEYLHMSFRSIWSVTGVSGLGVHPGLLDRPHSGGELQCSACESSRNHPPALVRGKTVFPETQPWCQEGGDRRSVAQLCCLPISCWMLYLVSAQMSCGSPSCAVWTSLLCSFLSSFVLSILALSIERSNVGCMYICNCYTTSTHWPLCCNTVPS